MVVEHTATRFLLLVSLHAHLVRLGGADLGLHQYVHFRLFLYEVLNLFLLLLGSHVWHGWSLEGEAVPSLRFGIEGLRRPTAAPHRPIGVVQRGVIALAGAIAWAWVDVRVFRLVRWTIQSLLIDLVRIDYLLVVIVVPMVDNALSLRVSIWFVSF